MQLGSTVIINATQKVGLVVLHHPPGPGIPIGAPEWTVVFWDITWKTGSFNTPELTAV